jgi:hypothetical protein
VRQEGPQASASAGEGKARIDIMAKKKSAKSSKDEKMPMKDKTCKGKKMM